MREVKSRSEVFEVNDAVRAGLLLDPQARRVLRPFMGQPQGVHAAAAQLGLKPNTLLKRVRTLVDLGLLHIVGEQRRGGRPIKLYASVAQRFFVPFHATSQETLEALVYGATEEVNRLIARGLAQQLAADGSRLGYLVTPYRDELRHDLSMDGRTAYNALLPQHPAFIRAWDLVRLDYSRAKQFQAELMDLLERYSGRQGEKYWVYLAFAPSPN